MVIDMTTTLHFSCACHRVTGSVQVPSSAIPLPMALCHCNTCRHISGSLCVSAIYVPVGSCLDIKGSPSGYGKTTITRYFCGNCGCFVYNENADSKQITICTGVLEKPEGLVELQEHIFVADTKDGGLSNWLPNAVIWQGKKDDSEQIKNEVEAQTLNSVPSSPKRSSTLRGHCYCGGVEFYITEPDESLVQESIPWPDVIIPHYSNSSQKNENAQWWLCKNKTKYLAGTCACNSCRLGLGHDIQTWAFIPHLNVFQSNGQIFELSAGTLKRFESSTGVYREFCQNCGATVFWHSDERRDILDVGVGLLHADSGARAEEWLEWWTARVSFEEYALNTTFVSQFSRGLKEWGEKKKSSEADLT